MAVIESKRSKLIDINNLHKILVHCAKVIARLTGKALGYEITGKFDVCESCSVSKARQKNVNNEWKGGSTTPGERLYVDTSSIKGNSFGGAKFWTLIVDDYLSDCWSYYLKRKDELPNKLVYQRIEEQKRCISCFYDLMMLEKIMHFNGLVRMKILTSSLNIVDLAHLKEMEKWNGSSRHYMDKSKQ
jgi:hypothetical protein